MDLDAFLRKHGITAARHEHPAVMTVEESERLVPKLPGAKTKNLFLRDKKGLRHFLVTVPPRRRRRSRCAGNGARRRPPRASRRRNGCAKHLGAHAGFGQPARARQRPSGARGVRHRSRAVGGDGRARASARQHGDDGASRTRDLERFLAATGHAPRVVDVPAAARR